MARMRRINIVIDPELDDRLEREAELRGMSKSALVRECVDRLIPESGEHVFAALARLRPLFADVEPVDIDTELYGPLEANS